jgi:hypothetical protein
MNYDETARDTALGLLNGCGLGAVCWTLLISVGRWLWA